MGKKNHCGSCTKTLSIIKVSRKRDKLKNHSKRLNMRLALTFPYGRHQKTQLMSMLAVTSSRAGSSCFQACSSWGEAVKSSSNTAQIYYLCSVFVLQAALATRQKKIS